MKNFRSICCYEAGIEIGFDTTTTFFEWTKQQEEKLRRHLPAKMYFFFLPSVAKKRVYIESSWNQLIFVNIVLRKEEDQKICVYI